MLTEEEIRQALHADRVVALPGINPHGPLGLEHLAEMVAQLPNSPLSSQAGNRVRRPLELSLATWEKLGRLADQAGQATAHRFTASDLAAAILEQYVTTAR